MKIIKGLLAPTIGLIILIVLRWTFVEITGVSSLVVPGPDDVFMIIIQRWYDLLYNMSITILESIAGLFLAVVSTIIIIIFFYFLPILKKCSYPWLIAFRAIPVIALAPLISLWAGTGIESKIILATLISFFPIVISTLHGFNSLDKEIKHVWKTFNISNRSLFHKIHAGYILPDFLTGLQIASTFSIIGAIVAEFSSSTEGIGYLIKTSTYYSETALTFAGIIAAGLSGMLIFGLTHLIKVKLLRWKEAI